MKRKFLSFVRAILLMNIVLFIISCSCVGRKCEESDDFTIPIEENIQKINFFIENSGSMKGYFTGSGISKLETIINDYYDRSEELENVDTITLNYINTRISESKENINIYLKNAKSQCTESYTKIDEILKMSMDSLKNNDVNIVISDFCFESDYGSLDIAQSKIKKLFNEQIKKNNSLAVAIIKYMVDFNGYYYPGGIPCNKEMPIYFWVFGRANHVKAIINLKTKAENCGLLLLQTNEIVKPKIYVRNKRAVCGQNIMVKDWASERSSGKYEADIRVYLGSCILGDKYLCNVKNYRIKSNSSSNYKIATITKDSLYTYKIVTDHPSPGQFEISYPLSLPKWVENYNFDKDGLPEDSTTFGIKYLIKGVYDAYNNINNNFFSINVNILE